MKISQNMACTVDFLDLCTLFSLQILTERVRNVMWKQTLKVGTYSPSLMINLNHLIYKILLQRNDICIKTIYILHINITYYILYNLGLFCFLIILNWYCSCINISFLLLWSLNAFVCACSIRFSFKFLTTSRELFKW